MNKYPTMIKIKDKYYTINTDFRIALECDEVARDNSICDYEKILTIIYLLLGENALNDYENHEEIFNLCQKFLQRNKNEEDLDNDEEDELTLDFKQDESYIKASFMSDYKIELDSINMHWWAFLDLLSGLTEDSVLSRVRYIRQEPLEDKKGKEREQWIKMKKSVALKKNNHKTDEEIEMDNLFEKQMKGE